MTNSATQVLNKVTANASKSAVIVEFIGTFLVTLTIPLATANGQEVSALAIGSMLMAMGFSFGYLSGAHMNPAISLGVYFAKAAPGFTLLRCLTYIIVQLIAAHAGVFYVVMIQGTDFPTPNVPFDLSILRMFFTEIIFTFVIVTAMLHLQTSKEKHTAAYGFALGMPATAAFLAVGGINGGTFNPATCTALLVVRCLTLYCFPLLRIWVYLLAHLIAAILAAIVYRTTIEAASGPSAVATS